MSTSIRVWARWIVQKVALCPNRQGAGGAPASSASWRCRSWPVSQAA
ncbi:hypothetical protein ACWV95_13950 [Streptomyces albus]